MDHNEMLIEIGYGVYGNSVYYFHKGLCVLFSQRSKIKKNVLMYKKSTQT